MCNITYTAMNCVSVQGEGIKRGRGGQDLPHRRVFPHDCVYPLGAVHQGKRGLSLDVGVCTVLAITRTML